jgi:hypothetical protein
MKRINHLNPHLVFFRRYRRRRLSQQSRRTNTRRTAGKEFPPADPATRTSGYNIIVIHG